MIDAEGVQVSGDFLKPPTNIDENIYEYYYDSIYNVYKVSYIL